MSVPGIRIYEDIICHHYYARQGEGKGFRGLEGDIDEDRCKGLEVQNELSFLLAGLHVVGALPREFPCPGRKEWKRCADGRQL